MFRKWWFWVLVGSVLVGLVFAIVKINTEKNDLSNYEDHGVPIIEIELNGVSLEEIKEGSKDEKYENNYVGLRDNKGIKKYGGVEVKGRGNLTWSYNKKPFRIKFSNKVDLFGLGKSRKWVLLANATDATKMRTDIAFYLEEMLGMEYALKGKSVELYIDGDYQGLYYLTHSIEIDKQMVSLKDPMGILVELDNVYNWEEEYVKTNNHDNLVVKDVVARDMKEAALEEFLDKYNQFEDAVSKKDYDKISEIIDVRSFAQYYLLSEFIVNPDAYWTSFYMYKDGVKDKIHAGPGWDFDFALANRAWGNWMGEDFYSPVKTMVRREEIMSEEEYEEKGLIIEDGQDWYKASLNLTHIMFDLMEIPEFQEEVKDLYRERMMGREDELIWIINKEAENIKDAIIHDEEKWGEKGYWQEVDEMKKWVSERYKYFEKTYTSDKDLLEE